MLGTGLSGLMVAAAAAAEKVVPVPVVVFTGLFLVFGILLILILVVKVQGMVFSSAKKKSENSGVVPQAEKNSAVAQPTPAAPAVPAGIAPEIVAVIAAAVAAQSGGRHTVRAVRLAGTRRGEWGRAGVLQSTEPF